MSTPTPAAIETLRAAVQTNCDISDARHAGDFSLCIYLLKMREYYRWEKRLGFADEMSQSAIGEWLREREEHWNDLAEESFVELPLEDRALDPFDADNANLALTGQGYVYSAGYGRNARPHFVLARLEQHDRYDDFQVYHCAEELARDLSAPPAMTQGDTIYLRRESIRRMIFEKIQESDWHTESSPSHRLMRYYDYAGDPEGAIERMSHELGRSILDHEIGEFRAGTELGEAWEQMLMAFAGSRAEIVLRALRDLFADCLVTLPRLLESAHPGSIHYYASNMSGMRRHLFPAFQDAYHEWTDGTGLARLRELVPRAESHWRRLCAAALDSYRRDGEQARTTIESTIEEQRL